MIRKIEAFMREHRMVQEGDHVIAGVSGGADSICLLRVLLCLRTSLGYTVSVVHVEHGIRGNDSLRDAAFVKSYCEKRGVECRICGCRVPEYAKEHGMSEEEAGRHLRYAAFEAEKERYPGRQVKIAVAHNLGDQAETMLFHLVRGTGIRGLAGMAPVRGHIIRPLLSSCRDEIEKYLADIGQPFCVDITNETDAYSRNQIRRNVLSVLHQINGKAAEHMYQAAGQLREIDDYIKRQAASALETCCVYQKDVAGSVYAAPREVCKDENRSVQAGDVKDTADSISATIRKEVFMNSEPVLQKEMIHQLLSRLAGSSRDFTREHVWQVIQLFEKQNGRWLRLPYGLKAERVYDGVKLCRRDEQEGKSEDLSQKDQFSFEILEKFSNYKPQISKKKYTKCFDYDKIKFGVCVRTRLPGDYLVVNDSGSRQKLKKYLVNEKIPVEEREQLLLLADGAHIMWVVGHRISSYYKVDEHTRRILEVTFYGGEEDE